MSISSIALKKWTNEELYFELDFYLRIFLKENLSVTLKHYGSVLRKGQEGQQFFKYYFTPINLLIE